MSKVMVVTDSTSNIPLQLLNGNPVKFVPLQVIWGHTIYNDGVDIQPDEFYQRLGKDPVNPSTSQATPEEFKKVYASLLDQGYDILSLHISSKLSGTLDSAFQAKRAFPGANISIVDSLSTSMALGFQVLAASRMAEMGATLDECRVVAEKAVKHTGVYFTVSTLEYLRRGGRIGSAAAFMGTVLDLKPILQLKDGVIEAVEKVRTLNKAIDRILDLVEKEIGHSSGPIRLAAIQAGTIQEGQALLEKALKRFSSTLVTDAVVSGISPVLGTHAGPGALGLAYMAGM
ncbi:MAG: DegV family protein [Anaerolineaceae bacterium]